MPAKFFTNNDERNLFDKFKGIIEHMKDLYAFHVVIGYFRSSGYFALQPYFNDIKEIKILVGINVDQMFAESQRKGLLYFGDENMDANKLIKLNKINYEIKRCCGICEHANVFNDNWSTCKIHTYEHEKHSEANRQLSIFKFGYCSQFKFNAELGTWKEFLK
mgnify:CR=1 FL=1